MASRAYRRPMVAGNWKMHLTHLEAIAHTQRIAFTLRPADTEAVETVLLPAFTALRSVQTLVDADRLPLGYGAQDLSPYPAGAHTGDVSAPMLAALGCRYVVVGHSERRADHHDDAAVPAKISAAYDHGLVPILCVGETHEVRAAERAHEHVLGQLDAALAQVSGERAQTLVLAYEPVWAIGSGRTATPGDAQEMCAALRSRLAMRYDDAIAASVRVLYGGSVTAATAADLFAGQDVDGGLVGGASLDADAFVAIVRAAA